MKWLLWVLLLAAGCSDSSTPVASTDAPDPLDGRRLEARRRVDLVSIDQARVQGVLEVVTRTFAGGAYSLTVQSFPPPGVALPFDHLLPRYRVEGRYWLEDCGERLCSALILEQAGGHLFDVVTGERVTLGYHLDVLPIAWGEAGVRIGTATYQYQGETHADRTLP